MIRSIGSSLLAKAGTGSLSRKKEEERLVKPEIPGKGAVGTAPRELVQETNITPVAPGSEKVIRSAPGVESASLPGTAGVAPSQVPLVAGMGTPGGAMAGGGQGNQPMFAGGAPASAPGQAGRQAVAGVSRGAPVGEVAASRAARAAAIGSVPESSSMGYQAPRAKDVVGSFFPGIANLGGRVNAEGEGGGTINKNLAQAIVATLSPKGSKGEAWGTNPAVTKSGVGSVHSVLKGADKIAAPLVNALYNLPTTFSNIGSGLRSVTQQAKNTFSNLRSKIFGR